MICPTCDRETAAVCEIGEMGAGKLRKRCGHSDCKAPLPEERPVRQLPTLPLAPAMAREIAHALDQKPPAHANGAPPSFAQIVAEAEARLLQVRARIAELRALETEEKQLSLILTAAGKTVPETKPS